MRSGFLASALALGIASAFATSANAEIKPVDRGALAFEMPSPAQLDDGGRQVFAHYFTPYPISIDNEPSDEDYYATEYLDPSGEDGRWEEQGGQLRQRPLPRPVSTSASWDLEDMETEVRRAIFAGIDGFTVDIVGLEGFHWHRVELLIEAAAAVDPDFEIVLMPDAYTGVTDDPDALADALASVADEPAVHHLDDGRLVVAPFLAEGVGAAYWQDWMALMADRGIEVALVPVLLDYPSNVAAFADFSAGISVWGARSPASVSSLAELGSDARDRGLLWMQPVAVQDVRPKTSVFDEANNTELLRDMWSAAEDSSAEWVQLVTWNDYSESSEFAPSTNTGWSILDINAYYIAAFKTGRAPDITSDRVYVSHRVQPVGARPTGGQTSLMSLRAGSSPPRDRVEVLTFLRDGADVTVSVGATTHTYAAPAGVHAAHFPLATGTVEVVATAPDGTVSAVRSPSEITDAPVVQDLQYRFAGSAREGPEGIPPVQQAADQQAGATTTIAPSDEAPTASSGASLTSTGAVAEVDGSTGRSTRGDPTMIVVGGVTLAVVVIILFLLRRTRARSGDPLSTPPVEHERERELRGGR